MVQPRQGVRFVQLADGSGDAFLHVSVVERSGHGSVPPGAMLEVRAGPGPNLAQCRHRHAEADGALGGVDADSVPSELVSADHSSAGSVLQIGTSRRQPSAPPGNSRLPLCPMRFRYISLYLS